MIGEVFVWNSPVAIVVVLVAVAVALVAVAITESKWDQ